MALKNRADISELNDALRDLRETSDEARDEGPQPSDMALGNAERLLREMYGISPRRFEVYPTPDGEIAIDAPDGHGRSVILLCDSAGGALCLVNFNGNHRRARYSTTETLPDGFVHEALAPLKQLSPWHDTNRRKNSGHFFKKTFNGAQECLFMSFWFGDFRSLLLLWITATAIADETAAARDATFYGWAVVSVIPDNGNPYHADIILPELAGEDREEQKRHAQERGCFALAWPTRRLIQE